MAGLSEWPITPLPPFRVGSHVYTSSILQLPVSRQTTVSASYNNSLVIHWKNFKCTWPLEWDFPEPSNDLSTVVSIKEWIIDRSLGDWKVPYEKSLPTRAYRFQTSHSMTISHVRNRRWLGMVAQVCDPSTQEATVRGFQVEGPHRIKRNCLKERGGMKQARWLKWSRWRGRPFPSLPSTTWT